MCSICSVSGCTQHSNNHYGNIAHAASAAAASSSAPQQATSASASAAAAAAAAATTAPIQHVTTAIQPPTAASALSAQYLDLNNTASNISVTNLRTNSYKINDNNYSLYNNNQFGECNHLLYGSNIISKTYNTGASGTAGTSGATGVGTPSATSASASVSSSAGGVGGGNTGDAQTPKDASASKSGFFKNFARSSSFLNGCKIRPGSKKLRNNVSLKLKKSERPTSSSASCAHQHHHHQLSCQNLYTSTSLSNNGGSCGASTVSQLLGAAANGGGASATVETSATAAGGSGSKRASLKTLNDSIRNVYRANNSASINSDLKNQYNAKSNNECNSQQHVLLNDFTKSPGGGGGGGAGAGGQGGSLGSASRTCGGKATRSKCFDRQLSVPIDNSHHLNNLGVNAFASHKHCHSYSNSLNRSKKNAGKPNGR